MNAQPEVALHKTGGTAAALTTTPVAPFSNLAATADARGPNTVQDIVVVNLDATAYVCVKAIACSASACSTTPTSGNFTCLGGFPGLVIPPGGSRHLRWTGEVKIWAVANEADADAQFERSKFYASGAQAVR